MDIKQKRQRFNALLSHTQTMHAKEHILSSYGVRSTLDLKESDLDKAISRLEGLIKNKSIDASKDVRTWRHKCLCMIKECGIDTNNWNAVNEFVLNKRIAGKHLYELSVSELENLHRKLYNVRDNKLKKQTAVERLTKLN